MERCHLVSVFTHAETIFPAVRRVMPCIIRHGEPAPAFAERVATFGALVLGALPANTLLFGAHHFLMEADGAIIEEYITHAMRKDDDAIVKRRESAGQIHELPQECLLLTRYGHGTWGHWLGEILPQAAVVERAFPGRFRYAVPHHASPYGDMMQQSLRAYGIADDRVLLLSPDQAYRPLKALVLTPVWSSFAPHPAALDTMRGAVALGPYRETPGRIIIADRQSRGLENVDDFDLPGFARVRPETLSFVDQVRLYQGAERIIATLGSGLMGLTYSPDEVRVVAMRPNGWRDRFFYGLAQMRRAHWAEVQGPSTADTDPRLAPFRIDPAALGPAMEAVGI